MEDRNLTYRAAFFRTWKFDGRQGWMRYAVIGLDTERPDKAKRVVVAGGEGGHDESGIRNG